MAHLTGAAVTELTLDPLDWNEQRQLAHRMLDDIFDHLETLRDQPAWQPLPEPVREALSEPLPRMPQGEERVYRDFLRYVLPYTTGNRHPRAWGWVRGNGTPFAMMAEMLAAGINTHAAGGQQAATYVEEQTLAWLTQIMEMPADTSGIFVSGGTMANLLGLAVARHAKAGFDVREEGLQNAHRKLVVYGSSETHMWAQKSVEFLGLGRAAFRRISVNDNFQINIKELKRRIKEDRAAGLQPIALIATAGTVNTGAVDDFSQLARLCKEEDIWLHIDGAFGALLKFSPQYKHLVSGIELADSLAFDLHKWMYLPFEIGCLLVRDAEVHAATFAAEASYLEKATRGMLADGLPFSDRGIELSRGFKALKVWMSLKAYGTEMHGQLIAQNVKQAEHLASLVQGHNELELLAPRSMNIVCFRYRPHGNVDQEFLNQINRELVLRLQESGEFVVSGTVLCGDFAIRVANTNHRSLTEDFDALVDAIVFHGRRIASELNQKYE
ncbi:MAG TPA: aminotransferase class V-fold PLP-dependent enzyme [Pseudacidobacterium sp.]|nr:aminotransferase class V-fold PLP-dependent enzyme [Pseudacidobacterium sp.]